MPTLTVSLEMPVAPSSCDKYSHLQCAVFRYRQLSRSHVSTTEEMWAKESLFSYGFIVVLRKTSCCHGFLEEVGMASLPIALQRNSLRGAERCPEQPWLALALKVTDERK